jgi:predicted dehydrogenase
VSELLIKYNFEYERRLRICYIGAGGHSFRNVLPSFQYAPVDLIAICDRQAARASAYARQFGANRFYHDHREMLEREQPEAVFIVTAYHPDGRVQATDLALDALRAGAHVWMEKPTAASSDEVRQLMAVAAVQRRYVMTGLKKIFFPAIAKIKEIIGAPAFGRPSSLYIRYPQAMPPFELRGDLRNMTGPLDHLYHPGAIIHYLMGKIACLSYEWEPVNGSSVTTLRFVSGAVGTLHLSAGASGSSPLERLEVIGEGANAVLENAVKLTYYRRAERPAYGRAASYLVDDETAPLYWEPEFSLGQLYNKNLFYLGYVPEVLHFCDSVLNSTPPSKGTLEEALEIMKLFEAYCRFPAGTQVTLNPSTA